MKPVIGPEVAQVIDHLVGNLPHALLLSGEVGIGLLTIAKHISGRDAAAVLGPTNTHGEADSMTGTIGVATIRDLYEATKGKKRQRQIAIVDDADRLSLGAQAAFLKLLEEPAPNTHFILTSHIPDSLLPTIRSRVQHVIIGRVTTKQNHELIKTLGITDATRARQIEFLADGRPAEMTRLAGDDAYFESEAKIIKDARDLLAAATTYQKLIVIQQYHTNRRAALKLIDYALTMLQKSAARATGDKVIEQLDTLLEIRERIAANGAIRLQLTRFVL